MNFVKLSDMYKKPSVYNPPNPEQLTNNADFPNLNSLEYRVKKVENTELKLQNFWEILEVDTLGQIVLVTNDYVTRIWTGSFWGYENFEDVGSETKAVYSKRYDHLITNFKFVEPNIALISDSSGGVHLWSTKSEIRNGYCPFSIIRRSEHIGRVDVLALFHKTGTKALSGCTNGCIKVWDLRGGDLSSSHTYRNAHTSHITGLSSSHTKPTVFASCSRDKKWAVWDHRNRKPITILSSTHSIPYTTLYWSDSQENNENLIVGDSTGSVYTFDIRNPAKHIEMLKPLSSPIHKLSFEGKLLAVLGQTNMLKVIDTANANKEVYVNSDAKSNVRDIHWSDVDTFYTIAWETGLQKHRVANESCLQEF